MTTEDLKVISQIFEEVIDRNMLVIDGKLELIKQEVGHIKEQTTKTNGRVNKHDTQISELQNKESSRSGVWMTVKIVATSLIAISGTLIALMQLLD